MSPDDELAQHAFILRGNFIQGSDRLGLPDSSAIVTRVFLAIEDCHINTAGLTMDARYGALFVRLKGCKIEDIVPRDLSKQERLEECENLMLRYAAEAEKLRKELSR